MVSVAGAYSIIRAEKQRIGRVSSDDGPERHTATVGLAPTLYKKVVGNLELTASQITMDTGELVKPTEYAK